MAPKAVIELESRFAETLTALGPPWPAAVGVSGGGDSLALMLLLAQWAKTQPCAPPVVLTVDHGLRPDSHKDTQQVQTLAAAAGLDCHPLSWKGAKPSADIEAEARAARYSLMGRWCVEHQVPALYVAHTIEDQAETFLLRLARGSGLDGLSAMQPLTPLPVPQFAQVKLVRPLLDFSRAELRDYLQARGVEWREDPMNADPRFGRARIRAAWPALEDVGLTPQRLSDAAWHLARARAAMEEMTDGFLQRGTRFGEAGAWLDPLRLRMLPREVGLRALAFVLGKVSGAEYRPRFDSLERLFDSIADDSLGGGATLHGCIIAPAAAIQQVFGSATIAIFPEPERKSREPGAPSPRTKAGGGN